jgi:hypothetical protein
MENVHHYGSGKFGYKVVFENDQIAFSWFKDKDDRDRFMKDTKSKLKSKAKISKVER